jgi:large repetitive protein
VPGACAQEYTITRTWTATDACGNSTTASQTITVIDTLAPVISGVGASYTVACEGNVVFSSPTASDNCDTTLTFGYTDNTIAGACAQEYTITRTWTATDACGNSSTASQTITVIDTLAPVISGVGARLHGSLRRERGFLLAHSEAITATAVPGASNLRVHGKYIIAG